MFKKAVYSVLEASARKLKRLAINDKS
jgi:hypothetical protein